MSRAGQGLVRQKFDMDKFDISKEAEKLTGGSLREN